MAIINCPSCKNRVSTISRNCARCGADLMSVSPDEDARRERNRRRQLHFKLQLHAVASMMTVVAGVIWYYMQVRDGQPVIYAQTTIAVGIVWYAVTRMRTWFKR